MKATTILFDLDGTLLPMNLDVFMKAYFGGLAEHMAPYGYEPKRFIASIWQGSAYMVKNNGKRTNEEAFWDGFNNSYGRDGRLDEEHFAEFYRTKFDSVSAVCGRSDRAREVIDLVKKKGLRPVLATNPVFPSMATERRIRWAGLAPEDFVLFTSYENSSFCKPSLDYYRSITNTLGVSPEECVMVGNDVGEDMIAEKLGMRVFLLTDCLINKSGEDISKYQNGSFDELIEFISSL